MAYTEYRINTFTFDKTSSAVDRFPNFENEIWKNYFTQIHTPNKMSRTTMNYIQISTVCEDGSIDTEMDVPISLGK